MNESIAKATKVCPIYPGNSCCLPTSLWHQFLAWSVRSGWFGGEVARMPHLYVINNEINNKTIKSNNEENARYVNTV